MKGKRRARTLRLTGLLGAGLLAASLAGEEKYSLAFRPKSDRTLGYNLEARMDSEGKSFFGRSLTSLTARAVGPIDLAVKGMSHDRILTELRTSGIAVSLDSPVQKSDLTLATPPDQPVEVTFDSSMRIHEIRNVEALEKQNPLNFSILDIFRNCLPAYPNDPVGRGESWKDHKRMLLPFAGVDVVVSIDVTFTLDDVVLSSRGNLAFVSAAYRVALSGTRELEGFTAGFEGGGTGSGKLSCLLEEGAFTDYRLDYSVEGAMVLRKDGAQVTSWPFTLTMFAELNLVGQTPGE